MLISGFTFIRNAIKYDYPIIECIESMLPIVDELVICIGESQDDTEKLIAEIQSPKIRILRSVWDDSKVKDGLILSEQTNIALKECRGRWALYLQADEALHEAEYTLIRNAVEKEDALAKAEQAEALSFRYLHFYGGYTLVQRDWNWYPSEIRILRRDCGAESFGDAQSFRHQTGRALRSKPIPAHIYHYGHAREPEKMARKIHYFHRFWHGDSHGINVDQAYNLNLKSLTWYWGSHPHAYSKRSAQGLLWSPKPALWLGSLGVKITGKTPDHLVIIAHPSQSTLAADLKDSIEKQMPTLEIEIVHRFLEWAPVFVHALIRKILKNQATALVDLEAQSRGWFMTFGMLVDARSAFCWRIAHVPKGTLSRFRKYFYNAIAWGSHERSDVGFVVPSSEYPRQLLRWLGFNL